METREIENRVSILENEISTLKEKMAKLEKNPENWWQKVSGVFAGDADFEEAMRLGREFRIAQKEKK